MVAGTGGGGGPRYSNMDKPTTVAEIYDPSQPVGQRWKPVGDTQIPRLYHSVAFLTANATVSPNMGGKADLLGARIGLLSIPAVWNAAWKQAGDCISCL